MHRGYDKAARRGTTLTVTGNYVGSGGTLLFNTALGGDSSVTDRMVVQGATSGASTLRISNVRGSGAQTIEGIKVIDVAGASNGTFTLLGDYAINGQQAVVGGAYADTLQKSGVSTPTDGDWYLRSSLINPPPAAPAGPLYQPGVPLYENYGAVLLGMNQAPSLEQRVGNRYWGGSEARANINPAQASSNSGDGSWTQSAFWGRVEGGQAALQPSNTTGSTYNTDQMKVQTGLDGLVLDNDRGRLIVGLTAQYVLTNADVSSFFGNGHIRAEGTGVGATWYGNNGFYVDGQAQTMFYHSDLSSDLAGSLTHGNEGFGYTFSIGSGKRIGSAMASRSGRRRSFPMRRSTSTPSLIASVHWSRWTMPTACSAASGFRSIIRGDGTTARASFAPTSTPSAICITSFWTAPGSMSPAPALPMPMTGCGAASVAAAPIAGPTAAIPVRRDHL